MRYTATRTRPLGPETVRSWAARTEQWLADRRGELDTMNVFPVADSDTGTNLYLTFHDAAVALAALPDDASSARVARTWARGALVGARGNSGVIVGAYVGELVRGLVGDPPDGPGDVTSSVLVPALTGAADAAWRAVGEPVEGTVLTVARAVGEAAVRARTEATASGVLAVLEESIVEGYAALTRTTEQLAPLRVAGVLDAGGWGLLLVLDALADALGSPEATARAAGRPTSRRAGEADPRAGTEGVGHGRDGPATSTSDGHEHEHEYQHGGGEFEVMYLVGASPVGSVPDVASALRTGLAGVGESVAVVGADGLWQAHVHTDRPLDAIAVPAALGLPSDQVRARHLLPRAASDGTGGLGLVAVTRAPGLVADLARAGAGVVLAADGGVGPELARAVEDTGATQVLVLAAVPVEAVLRAGVEVRAGLTESQVVAGAATFATIDPRRDARASLSEVCDVVDRVRSAAVPLPGVGGPGDTGEVLTVAQDLLGDADALLADALLTVITAAGTPPEVVAGLRSGLARTHPAVEVVVLEGGTAGGDILLGVG